MPIQSSPPLITNKLGHQCNLSRPVQWTGLQRTVISFINIKGKGVKVHWVTEYIIFSLSFPFSLSLSLSLCRSIYFSLAPSLSLLIYLAMSTEVTARCISYTLSLSPSPPLRHIRFLCCIAASIPCAHRTWCTSCGMGGRARSSPPRSTLTSCTVDTDRACCFTLQPVKEISLLEQEKNTIKCASSVVVCICCKLPWPISLWVIHV